LSAKTGTTGLWSSARSFKRYLSAPLAARAPDSIGKFRHKSSELIDQAHLDWHPSNVWPVGPRQACLPEANWQLFDSDETEALMFACDSSSRISSDMGGFSIPLVGHDNQGSQSKAH